MCITADDIKKEISFYYPVDNRNGNKIVVENIWMLWFAFRIFVLLTWKGLFW